jgi:16S rRNA G966 N2-methylase RsmD
MKNHFYIPYCGNKRQEVKHIYDNIDFTDITTVVEPFCGSCAMSYYISTQREGLKYILNDNNKYLKEMYEIMLDNNKIDKFEKDFEVKVKSFKDNREMYNTIVKEDNLLSWFIKNKLYNIRPCLYPSLRSYKETINLKLFPIYNFFKNNDITFSNDCGLTIYEKYKNSKNNLILLDPPYINSTNDYYLNADVNIYEYLCNNNINNEIAEIILILENIWMIKLLFKHNKIKFEYDKKYVMSKKKTSHIIIGKK